MVKKEGLLKVFERTNQRFIHPGIPNYYQSVITKPGVFRRSNFIVKTSKVSGD